MIVLWHAVCVSLRLHRVAPQEALAVQQPFPKALKPTTGTPTQKYSLIWIYDPTQ